MKSCLGFQLLRSDLTCGKFRLDTRKQVRHICPVSADCQNAASFPLIQLLEVAGFKQMEVTELVVCVVSVVYMLMMVLLGIMNECRMRRRDRDDRRRQKGRWCCS